MQAGLRSTEAGGLGATLVLTACLMVGGCDDAPVPLSDARTSLPAAPRWNALSEATSPDVWLASLDSGDVRPPSAELVARFHRLLEAASIAYVETPRMVANRLVQAQDTIRETPGLEADATLEALFNRLLFRSRDGQPLLFGTVVHHYLNLLRQGVEKETAARRLAAELRAERVAQGQGSANGPATPSGLRRGDGTR